MKVRLMGTELEVREAVDELRRVFTVVDASRPYPCRGDSELVRVYLEVVR